MFRFQQFTIHDEQCAMKVGTDGVLLGAWAEVPSCKTMQSLRVLDIGTGSGLIALMLAQRFPAADVTGLDIDRQAALQARANFDASPWATRLHAYWADARHFDSVWPYDLIVSNPPYFIDSLKAPNHQRNTARHTDDLPFVDLLSATKRLLTPMGHLAIILPPTEADLLCAAADSDFALLRRTRVFSKPNEEKRHLLLFQNQNSIPHTSYSTQQDSLLLSDGTATRTPEYQSLTREFYL